ncbi:nucleoporin Nup186/Nup192/Nup205 [Rhodocollybia butyracea]|uniref:Nucleoporin Nup186/Nup192/Nup205 n=1 Tax=Rhodocollybia butyracea TaxID=206335 RepID=A0A9P5PXP2_9AGAR|nr:nucleoporin Nup186/Nup192/Nup205 [Rhodocollybia butyracea]
METIYQLRSYLLAALDGHGAQNGDQELFDALMLHKSRLASVFDVGIRNAQEQKEIESGKTTINGKQVAVNSEFARQVVFLSQQLECSERYIAGLLHSIMAQNPNVTPVSCLELAVAEFHLRRRHLVDCLRYLLEAAEAAQSSDAPPLYRHLEKYVRHDLAIPALAGGGEIPLAYRIFKEMENLGNVIARADNARKSAQTNTVIPQQGTPSLGFDISNARYDSLKYERRYLGSCLYLLSRLGLVSPNEIKTLVEWLIGNPNHSMTFYVLTTVLTVFDTVSPDTHGALNRSAIANDRALVSTMLKKLDSASEWKEPGLKATVLLKWTLFLIEHRHRNPNLEDREGFRTEELELQIWNAVQGDIFTYLSIAVLQLRRSTVSFSPSLLGGMTVPLEQQEQREVPADDFRMYILNAFEVLVRSLITHASSELRKIKQRQEDLVLANARTDRTRSTPSRFRPTSTVEPEKHSSPPRNDIAMLYSFIGLLYSNLPDESALQFWGAGAQAEPNHANYLEYLETTAGRLPAFLQWAVWATQTQDASMTMALYDMLAGISKGQQCSELAYNFMARSGGEVIPGSSLPSGASSVSWDTVFGLLESWASGPSVRSPIAPQGNSQSIFGGSSTLAPSSNRTQEMQLGPQEVLMAQSFLRLLSTVVTYSVAVRMTISGHVHFRAIPTLVSLIPLRLPLELKGMIFDTLAAFCRPGAGIPGVEICRAVWTLMERLEVINVRAGTAVGFGTPFISVKGVEVELEEIEATHGLYPATIPFLKLLSTLIHTPKRIPLKDRVSDHASANTIPESLGQPYRLPGIGPFVTFVIDNVFSKISTREYRRPSERWQMNDLCLAFIERVLASYDMESLLASAEEGILKENSIGQYLVHPGYEVMKRMLTHSALQTSVLSYVVEGLIGFEKGFAEEEPFFERTITRILRIVHRVLEIQDIFLDVLVPLISEFDSTPLIGTIHPRSYFVKFDQALSFVAHYAPAIAAYVAYPSHFEVVLLSVKIIDILLASSVFSNLAALIERSEDADRILGGYLQLLSVESSEDISIAETTAEQMTGAGAPDVDDAPISLEQATRTAVLDMLIHNTAPNRPYPNVAHYLLFGGTNFERGVQDPHALGARSSCVHIILQLLNTGVPTLKGKGKHSDIQTQPLFVSLPALAERCYHIIYQLCVHPRTSSSTMRYLRTREDFFTRHISVIPSQVPQMMQGPTIEVLYSDGSRVVTTVSTLSSFLRLRSWIFDLIALDLHVLTSKGRSRSISEVLDILFGNESVLGDLASWDDEVLKPFREVGQSHLRIIEFVQSLTFEWADSLAVKPVHLQLLAEVDLQACIRKDAAGCEIIDRSALLMLLTTSRRTLFAENKIVTPVQAQQLETETSYILESCAIENHRRQVVHATSTGFEAWRRMLDTTLTKCFDYLPQDHRENMLFDILHVLPPVIKSEDIHESTAVLLSEVVLSSITKLCEDRRHQIILQSAGGDPHSELLPAERLYSILRSILECIVGCSHVELVRGNLYATLINYVNLISSPEDGSLSKPQSLAVPFASTREASPFGDSLSVVPHVLLRSSPLQIQSLTLLKTGLERLLVTISRDAIDGSEVWRTVAFMLLDSLIQLSALEKQHPVLTPLVRQGILSNFVQGIKESDFLLQSVLKPDPDDLNPLYVYESKMSFFIRMAQTRTGAEQLLDVQLILILAQCDFLDARPEADASFVDHDSFLPSAIQRYHNLFMPSLQVVNAMLATLSGKHATASNQVLDFISRHSATVVILLKNETEDLSLALLEEVHLLVALCAQVLPLVPQSELVSTHSGFGAINAAILGLSTKFLGGGSWTEAIKPQTEGENLRASVLAPGFGSNTKFDIDVRKKERLLRKALVAYAGATSDFTEPEINLVLSPVHVASRYNERSSHFLATIPTVGDALEALNSLCQDLANTLKQISDISAELSTKDLIAVDNIQEILGNVDIDFVQDLEIGQKRNLICRKLERVNAEAQRDAKMTMNTLEMLLLLLWRHIVYYGEEAHGKTPQLNASTATAMRFLSTPEPQKFRLEVGKKLMPALQRLQTLIAVGVPTYFTFQVTTERALRQDETLLGDEWRANQAYVEIMCRRLRDSAAMSDESEMADEKS